MSFPFVPQQDKKASPRDEGEHYEWFHIYWCALSKMLEKICVTKHHVDVNERSDGRGKKLSVPLGGSNTIKQWRRKGKTSCQRKCYSRRVHYIMSRFGVRFLSVLGSVPSLLLIQVVWRTIKGIVQHFGKYTYSLSCQKLDEKDISYIYMIINMKQRVMCGVGVLLATSGDSKKSLHLTKK